LKELASYIDHTILNADATINDIKKVCEEAIKYRFASVCVNPYYVSRVKEMLSDKNIAITAVIGFPLGCTLKEVKAFEAKMAVNAGADELDMVLNIAALKNKEDQTVLEDIQSVVEASDGRVVKVIIETCLLNQEEKIKACELATRAGATFVKTSTGFSTGGATVEDVVLMKQHISTDMKVKASGGIRNYIKAREMIMAGADRIGASASVAIVEQKKDKEEGY